MGKRKFVDDEKKDIFQRLFKFVSDIKDCKISLFDSSEADIKKITSEVIGISVVSGRRILRNVSLLMKMLRNPKCNLQNPKKRM